MAMARHYKRRQVYNPAVDPSLDPPKDNVDYLERMVCLAPTDEHPANCTTSVIIDDSWSNGLHTPALDIDIPVEVVPSSTAGHCHLFFPTVSMSWLKYVTLLSVLADCGVIERGYAEASIARGMTVLRLPGVAKT